MHQKTLVAERPGVVIDRFIKDRGMSRKDFATFMRIKVKRLNDLINGDLRISANYAIALDRAAGDPLRNDKYWMSLQNDYDLSLIKQDAEAAQ